VLDEPTEDLAGRIRIVIGRLGRRLRLTHAGNDISPSQLEVLGTLVRRGSLRLAELAEIEGMNPTMLSRVASKLEEAGRVARAQDPCDGRVVHLAATEDGRQLYQLIIAERTDALLVGLGQLSEAERSMLGEALGVLESLAETLKRRPQ
jgi:DNA-binding MarR family transcriptional regulator